jgi:TolA-binding protein
LAKASLMWKNFNNSIASCIRKIILCLFGIIIKLEASDYNFSSQINHSDDLFNSALYSDAIPYYIEMLNELTKEFEEKKSPIEPAKRDLFSKIQYQLAQSYFYSNEFQKTIATLNTQINIPELNTMKKSLPIEALLLKGLAYRNLRQYDHASLCFKEYLAKKNDENGKEKENAQLELGLTYYLWGNLPCAKDSFAHITLQDTPSYLLSRLYLARIDISEKKYEDALAILTSINIPDNNILKYELFSLCGEVHFQLNNFMKAAEFFEKALPKRNHENANWYQDTLYYLGWSYLKIACDPLINKETQQIYFDKAEETFKKLINISADERSYLALSQFFIMRANRQNEENWYKKAEEILSHQENFISKEAKANATLLRGEAAPTYYSRNKFYRQLTQESSSSDSLLCGKGWYLQGLNDFEEAISLQKENYKEEARKTFEKAAFSLKKAYDLLQRDDHHLAAESLKYLAEANYHQDTSTFHLQAFENLDLLLRENLDPFLSDPEEAYYLHALVALHLGSENNNEKWNEIGKQSLKELILKFPRGKLKDSALFLLGTHYYKQGENQKAEDVFISLANEHPNSPLAGDALFWASNAAERRSANKDLVRNYRISVFENYPSSSFAAEAYFRCYTYKEYLQGDRIAMKHLNCLEQKFPNNIFVIISSYLIGIDQKRDRKSSEGKSIRKKNLTAAIDAFQKAETLFDHLQEHGTLPKENLEYLVFIRYRSIMERALANLMIAKESQGAKKQIFLQYAEEVFKSILNDFENDDNFLIKTHIQKEPYPYILEEASFYLAQTYTLNKNEELAEKTLLKMLERYQNAKITRGYFLSRVWYELALLALKDKNYSYALNLFLKSEDSSKGKDILSTDQKLDLLIQQSLCLKAMNQMDAAMLILSKVINEDAISGLRLKAMYLRAEIYELQERFELSKKQLEAISKKGGEWAIKAKTKLEENYGYQ